MVKDEEAERHAERMYRAHERSVRRQLIPPILFFGAIIVVVIISVVGYRRSHSEGEVDMTTHAMEVDYLLIGVGSTVYENVDPIDRSYGDYLYIGSDFYEIEVDTPMALFDRVGNLWYTGKERVETMTWTCEEEVTPEEVADMAEELITAFGDYEVIGENMYYWSQETNGVLGDNPDVAWVTCGLDEAGQLVIYGEAVPE